MIGTRFSRSNLGVLLAVLAAVLSLAIVVWPVASQAQEGSTAWLILSIVTGLGFGAAAGLADRHLATAKGLLFLGAAVRLVSAFVSGALAEAGLSAFLFDLAPAVLALAAAFTIGPVRRHAAP